MSQININNLYFHYDSPYQDIFSDLSLTISDNWKSALIGRNGRGKTTLFRLIAGIIKPTAGSVSVPMEVMCFPYSPKNDTDITKDIIKESIAPFSFWEEQMNLLLQHSDNESLKSYSEYIDHFMHFDGYTIDSQIEKEAAKMGLDADMLNRPFNTLSGGEKTRALILPLFLRKDCFPLLDEPTDHLDMNGRELLAEYLYNCKKGFIIASHDRYLLDICTDHIISINKSDISVTQGNYSTWKYQSDIEQQFEQRRHENLQREINSLEKAAQQRRKWSNLKEKEKTGAYDSGYVGHKAAKLMKRATAIEKRIDENIRSKKELLKNKETEHSLIMKSSGKSPERLISANDLSVRIGEKIIFSNLYLTINKGDRIAIMGKNGSGKTTLLNAISNNANTGNIISGSAFSSKAASEDIIDKNAISANVPVTTGDIFVARNIKISRAYQIPLWTNGFLKEYLNKEGIDITSFRFIMSAFGMTGEIFDHPLETFSKGQLRKIDLCRTIVSAPQLLIWDEPLNYLDIASREQLEEFIIEKEPTILFVEHDRTFIENAATDIIHLRQADS